MTQNESESMNSPTPTPIEPTQECLNDEIALDKSMSGSNGFYIACDPTGRRQSYAVCLHTNAAKPAHRGACGKHIECGNCPAQGLRMRETEAGRALFYQDRAAQLKTLQRESATHSSGYGYGRSRTSMPLNTRRSEPNSTPAPQRKHEEKGINTDLAGRNLLGDAINSLMKEQSK
jgi:hypothetical protein